MNRTTQSVDSSSLNRVLIRDRRHRPNALRSHPFGCSVRRKARRVRGNGPHLPPSSPPCVKVGQSSRRGVHTVVQTDQKTADPGFIPGLEGVVAFETEIAEPDRDGGALRYRGVNIEDLAGKVTFGDVWALLVDGRFGHGLPPAEPFPLPVHTGDVRVDVQAALAMLAPIWGYQPLLDITDDQARDQLARAAVMALSYVAQSARGIGQPGRAAVQDRPVRDHHRAVHGPLARRARPGARAGRRRLLGVRRRARPERLHVHRPGDRLHRRRRRGRHLRRDRRDVRPAARRRPGPGAADDRGGRTDRRRRTRSSPRSCRPARPADGLRPPGLPRRGPARPRAAPHLQGTGRRRATRWRPRWSRPR